MNYTEEQTEAINCDDDTLVINASAGSGKTSTLVGYALARPQQRMLYLAFNNSVAAEARSRFPANVESRTSHSLAYAAFGASYKHKMGHPRAKDAVDYLSTIMRVNDMGRDKYYFAQLALRRVSMFFASGSEDDVIQDGADAQAVLTPSGESLDQSVITNAAQRLWLAMKDKSNTQVQMPHDGYLKLYQLSCPDLSRYAVILLDEAQDTNPCVLNIFKRQRTRKVLVGDRHQNIYGFRQSVNAMAMVKGTRMGLTSSFRFGPQIAAVANAILGTFCDEKSKIKGLGKDNSPVKSTCYLYRTNAGLFDRGVKMLSMGKKPHFVGGVSGYGFDVIVDTWKLSSGQRDIRDPFIRRFESFAELAMYAESADDREIKSRLNIVDQYGARIPDLVARLLRADTDEANADATLTTAHRAKGLEWDHVILGDDFPDMMVGPVPRTPANAKMVEEKPFTVEEANLAYVACTRARKKLTPGDSLDAFLEWAGVSLD